MKSKWLLIFGLIWFGALLSDGVRLQPVAGSSSAQSACPLPAFRSLDANLFSNLAVATGDFNHDGFVDVAKATPDASDSRRNRIDVFRGNGQGAFLFEQTLNLPTALALRSGDFNGDGIPDVLVLFERFSNGNAIHTVSVWRGQRNGSLIAWAEVSVPTPQLFTRLFTLTVADFNNDARTDIAINNDFDGGRIHILLGNNVGLIVPPSNATLPRITELSTGDLNLDGSPDLMGCARYTGRVQWLAGRGDGTFEPAADIYTARSQIITAAVVDFDQAGRRDLLIMTGERIANNADDFVRLILLQRGANGYATHRSLKVNFPRRIHQVVDVNNDSKPDVFLRTDPNDSFGGIGDASAPNSPLIFNDGNGGLCAPTSINKIWLSEHLADLNQDGRTDVIQRNKVLLNEGGVAGNTPPRITPLTPLPSLMASGVASDLWLAQTTDDESRPEMLKVTATSPNQQITIWSAVMDLDRIRIRATASCGLAAGDYPITVTVTDESGAATTATMLLNVMGAPAAPRVSSLPEIRMTAGVPVSFSLVNMVQSPLSLTNYQLDYAGTDVTMTLNGRPFRRCQGNTGVTSACNYWFDLREGRHQVQVEVFNSCGLKVSTEFSILVTGPTASCLYPAFTEPRAVSIPGTPGGTVVADFNSDQRSDIAVNAGGMIHLLHAQTNGEFVAAGIIADTGRLIAADFNRDGKPDLAIATTTLRIHLNNGNGSFTRQTRELPPPVVVGDFNQDGATDLVAFGSGSLLQLGLNDGQGNFTFSSMSNDRPYAYCVATDVNSDAKLDVACGSSVATVRSLILSVYYGDGTGKFTYADLGRSAQWAAFYWPDRVFAVQYERDRLPGLAVAYFTTDDGAIRAADHPELRLGGSRYYSLFPNQLFSADFNLDGKPDVVTDAGKVFLANKNTTGYCAAPNLGTPSISGTGDFNGDGKPDLLTQTADSLRVQLNRTNSLSAVSAASYSGTTLAPNQIAAAFGSSLAATTTTASTTPLPNALANIEVILRDSLGIERPAPLFFVSPGQVNFLVPADTAPGSAQVLLRHNNELAAATTVTIAPLAPGLFTVNATGKGLAAAQVLRVLSDSTQGYEPIARYDEASKQFVALPIDLSNAAEQVFLILYGTGLRGRSSLANVTTTIGGVACETLYASAQGSLVGLDQVNVRLPRSLAGRGEVEVVFTADGKTANAVRVDFK